MRWDLINTYTLLYKNIVAKINKSASTPLFSLIEVSQKMQLTWPIFGQWQVNTVAHASDNVDGRVFVCVDFLFLFFPHNVQQLDSWSCVFGSLQRATFWPVLWLEIRSSNNRVLLDPTTSSFHESPIPSAHMHYFHVNPERSCLWATAAAWNLLTVHCPKIGQDNCMFWDS